MGKLSASSTSFHFSLKEPDATVTVSRLPHVMSTVPRVKSLSTLQTHICVAAPPEQHYLSHEMLGYEAAQI